MSNLSRASIEPLSGSLGAMVSGLDLRGGLDDATVSELRDLILDRLVLVLPDQNLSVADIPLTTVTVFKGDTNAKAHTFSYWVGIKGYGQIAQIISDFAAAHPTSCQGIFSE